MIKDFKVYQVWHFLFQYVEQLINAHNSIFFQNTFNSYIMLIPIFFLVMCCFTDGVSYFSIASPFWKCTGKSLFAIEYSFEEPYGL